MPTLKRSASTGAILKNAGGVPIHTCSSATLVSDCCTDRGGIPDELTLTITRSECAAVSVGQTVTLTWNGSQWEGTMTCSGGGTINWVFKCNDSPCTDDADCVDNLKIEWGEPSNAAADNNFTCDPFFWESTEGAGNGVQLGTTVCNNGCASGEFVDVTITE